MLDKVKSATTARVSATRSGAAGAAAGDGARAREIVPAGEGSGIHDEPRRRDSGQRDGEPAAGGRKPGAAVRRAIDQALRSLPDGAGGAAAAAAGPHGRAAEAYGLQADLQGRRAALRPGAVFSARY